MAQDDSPEAPPVAKTESAPGADAPAGAAGAPGAGGAPVAAAAPSAASDPTPPAPKDDILLNEAQSILADYVELQRARPPARPTP